MRTLATRTAAAVATIAAVVAALAGGATAAAGAEDGETRASIYVLLDNPDTGWGLGPKEFEVHDVVVGDGPELTGENWVPESNTRTGDVTVDVYIGDSPFEGTVRVSGMDGTWESAQVFIELEGAVELGGAHAWRDGFLAHGDVPVDVSVDAGIMHATWEQDTQDEATRAELTGTTEFWTFEADGFPFIDAHGTTSHPAYTEHWMPITYVGAVGISEGWQTAAGREYRPYQRTTRDALAAFLYRFRNGETTLTDEDAPFIDVSSDPASPHYSEHWEAIYWMAEEGLSTGWTTDEGQEYRPDAQVTRDAIAQFFYRIYGQGAAPDADPFVDVSRNPESGVYSEHAGAIAWMNDVGLSTGWSGPGGPTYRPTAKVTRDAVAAFIFRQATRLG